MENMMNRPNRFPQKPPRSSMGSVLVLLKKTIQDSLSSVMEKTILKELLNGLILSVKEIGKTKDITTSLELVHKSISEQLVVLSSKTYKVDVERLSDFVDKIDTVSEKFEEVTKNIGVLADSENKNSPQLAKLISELHTSVKRIQLVVPQTQKVTVQNPTEFPITEMMVGLRAIQNSIQKIHIDIPKPQEIKIPAFPTSMSLPEGKLILESLAQLKDAVNDIHIPQVDFPTSISVANFPPQKIAMPPTNININPLRGVVKATGVTVTATETPLPTTRLRYRRSWGFYNNSDVTVYFGGSGVSVASGTPVPARSYSPSLDAGPNMEIYAIVASTSADVRVLEVSNESIGKENLGD